MKKNILENLINFTLSTELIPLILCLFFFKKINSRELKVFFIYAIIQVVFISSGALSIYILKSYKLYILLLRAHLIFEFIFTSLFFKYLFNKKIFNVITSLTIPVFIVYNLVDVKIDGLSYFDNKSTLIEFLFFIVIIIFYFFELIKLNVATPIYRKISFWICVGLFFYFTGNFFYILLVENSRNESVSVKNQLIFVYSIVTIIKNLILGGAFFAGNEGDDNPNNFISFPSDIDLDAITPNNKLQ